VSSGQWLGVRDQGSGARDQGPGKDNDLGGFIGKTTDPDIGLPVAAQKWDSFLNVYKF
jgi:hypothetical protein